ASRRDAAERQHRLLVARQQARLEAVAPLELAEERLAVVRVAHRARRDRQRPLGTERIGFPPVVREHVPDARDRERQQAAALVDALAEPRDAQPADDIVDPAVLDVGDEQARRVRADVYRADARHFVGRNARMPRTALRTSWTASSSTRARASDRFRRATVS